MLFYCHYFFLVQKIMCLFQALMLFYSHFFFQALKEMLDAIRHNDWEKYSKLCDPVKSII